MRRIAVNSGFGRKIVIQIVVQLDAIKACVLRQLQTLAQAHAVGIRKSPKIDRLEHLVAFRRASARVRFRRADWLKSERGKAERASRRLQSAPPRHAI
jgi:hypothetical protein